MAGIQFGTMSAVEIRNNHVLAPQAVPEPWAELKGFWRRCVTVFGRTQDRLLEDAKDLQRCYEEFASKFAPPPGWSGDTDDEDLLWMCKTSVEFDKKRDDLAREHLVYGVEWKKQDVPCQVKVEEEKVVGKVCPYQVALVLRSKLGFRTVRAIDVEMGERVAREVVKELGGDIKQQGEVARIACWLWGLETLYDEAVGAHRQGFH